eukprot:4887311-Amphidinium_carterae.1
MKYPPRKQTERDWQMLPGTMLGKHCSKLPGQSFVHHYKAGIGSRSDSDEIACALPTKSHKIAKDWKKGMPCVQTTSHYQMKV